MQDMREPACRLARSSLQDVGEARRHTVRTSSIMTALFDRWRCLAVRDESSVRRATLPTAGRSCRSAHPALLTALWAAGRNPAARASGRHRFRGIEIGMHRAIGLLLAGLAVLVMAGPAR